MSIEGFNIDSIDEYHKAQSEFRSHLSDDSRQDASTTHAYMISMLNGLEKGKNVNPKCNIWEVLMVVVSNIVVLHRCVFFL